MVGIDGFHAPFSTGEREGVPSEDDEADETCEFLGVLPPRKSFPLVGSHQPEKFGLRLYGVDTRGGLVGKRRRRGVKFGFIDVCPRVIGNGQLKHS